MKKQDELTNLTTTLKLTIILLFAIGIMSSCEKDSMEDQEEVSQTSSSEEEVDYDQTIVLHEEGGFSIDITASEQEEEKELNVRQESNKAQSINENQELLETGKAEDLKNNSPNPTILDSNDEAQLLSNYSSYGWSAYGR